MENCSCPNSGTEIHTHLKLGTDIQQTRFITWHDSNVRRSKVKFGKSRNVSR